MANQKIVVDPITRIEGHLRMQAVMDDNNVIVDAMSTGTMWRGLEVILKGRDPRDAWAFVERICGVCTGIHALSAVRAVEDALGIKIPKNANIIRNLMNATLYCQRTSKKFKTDLRSLLQAANLVFSQMPIGATQLTSFRLKSTFSV